MRALDIQLVPCLADNYAYLIRDPEAGTVGVVDPSEAEPVRQALAARGWRLDFILNTHHHFDHTGGNLDLKAESGAQVVGPAADAERIPGIDIAVGEDAPWTFGGHQVRIFDIPGHTKGHIAFWFPDADAAFTGDTLFSIGCGRMFEGTPEQFQSSLAKLAGLPDATRIYCGHEYTASNIRFALSVEPGNAALQARAREVEALRAAGQPTIPATIGAEKAANPFLRWASAELRAAVGGGSDVAVFAETRRRKDTF
ncbi:hydroxyacylglutathione hydrolase [Zavarzinia sp. CC-PAN008]|uniref:hydroxyacylglutathione hydrolase n=1 Tax=Zavarzinia sp. CC-PAN008 TaxID=3243332 RepID=UPI003F744CA0